jgi:hypothetical protein
VDEYTVFPKWNERAIINVDGDSSQDLFGNILEESWRVWKSAQAERR